MAVSTWPVVGAVALDTLTAVVAEFNASVLALLPVLSWLNVGHVNVPVLKLPDTGDPRIGLSIRILTNLREVEVTLHCRTSAYPSHQQGQCAHGPDSPSPVETNRVVH